MNGGQAAYVSTQELILLLVELAPLEPDLVIVADGYNDLHHALLWGVRPPANLVGMDLIDGMRETPGALRQRPTRAIALRTLLDSSRLLEELGVDSRWIVEDPGLPGPSRLSRPVFDAGYEALVQHRLVMNWTLLDRLGRALGLPVLVALQPVVFVKEPLADEERDWMARHDWSEPASAAWRRLETHVASEAERLGLARFDADRYVRHASEGLFTDYCHLTPLGNERFARAMADAVLARLAGGRPSPDWSGIAAPGLDTRWRPLELSGD